MGRKKTSEYVAECKARGIDISAFFKQLDYIAAIKKYDSETAGEEAPAVPEIGDDSSEASEEAAER